MQRVFNDRVGTLSTRCTADKRIPILFYAQCGLEPQCAICSRNVLPAQDMIRSVIYAVETGHAPSLRREWFLYQVQRTVLFLFLAPDPPSCRKGTFYYTIPQCQQHQYPPTFADGDRITHFFAGCGVCSRIHQDNASASSWWGSRLGAGNQ